MARKDRVDRSHFGVTRVEEKRNITTGRSTPIRFTAEEIDQLDLLVEKIQKKIPQKKISKSKVLRASVYLQGDKRIAELIKSIKENV